ncbi:MAG: insulinase family protein [Oscillospiraceae bacterium]|nr:insulinase family protein [Oscillospiraceae bacterium]
MAYVCQYEHTVLRDERTGDVCTCIQHPSGLEIRVMEQPGFSTAHAMFGTKYGSIHTRFRLEGDPAYTEVPEGIAHFLEHKLFENEDCDTFALFNREGACANAYTSFDRTVYLFSCSRNFDRSLEILLDFVQKPYFTEATVEKEQGIIAQEIKMYLDDPGDRLFFQLLRGLYHNHPVQLDVAGSVESIAQITPELLYACYRTFYNLHNMVLCCAGNITVEQVLAVADRMLVTAPKQKLEAVFLPEPETVVKPYACTKMAVGKTMFMIGFKSSPEEGLEELRAALTAMLTFAVIAGSASPLYQKLMSEQLINDAFNTDYLSGDGFFCMLAGGESDDPQAVLDALLEEIERVKAEGLDINLFNTLKRAAYGEAITANSAPEGAVSTLVDSFMTHRISPFARAQVLSSLTPEDAMECLRQRFRADRVCLSVIAPHTTES